MFAGKYALQVDITKPLNLTQSQLEQFTGILFLMSIVKMLSTCDYWDCNLQFQNISNVMSVKCFEKIKRFHHCNDNRSIPVDCTDKLCKIRPVIDALLECFQLLAPTEYLCIDEKLVSFKGRSKLKQYNPQNSKKWEYKLYVPMYCMFLYVLTEVQIFNLGIHTGTTERCEGQRDLEASHNIALLKMSRNNWYKLSMDNWYIGAPLVSTLMQQDIVLVATVRSYRLKDCVLSNDKVMRQKSRGS